MSSYKPLKSKDRPSSHLPHTPKSPKSSKNQNPSSPSSHPPNPPKSSKTKKPSSSSSSSQPPYPPQSPEKPKPSSSPHPQNPKKLEASPSRPSNPPKSQKEPKPSPHSNMSNDPDASAGGKGSAAASAALLRAAAEFRSRTGASPTASTVGPFFEFFKDSLTPLGITEAQIRNKIRHLRHKFNQAASKGDQDTPFYKLSLEAWGAPGDKSTTPHRSLRENNNLMDEDDYEQDEENDDEDDDEGDLDVLYPIMTQQLSEYWKKNDLSEALLEEKLKLTEPKKAREVEKRWVKHLEDGLKLREMQQNLNNEMPNSGFEQWLFPDTVRSMDGRLCRKAMH